MTETQDIPIFKTRTDRIKDALFFITLIAYLFTVMGGILFFKEIDYALTQGGSIQYFGKHYVMCEVKE